MSKECGSPELFTVEKKLVEVKSPVKWVQWSIIESNFEAFRHFPSDFVENAKPNNFDSALSCGFKIV